MRTRQEMHSMINTKFVRNCKQMWNARASWQPLSVNQVSGSENEAAVCSKVVLHSTTDAWSFVGVVHHWSACRSAHLLDSLRL